MRVDFDNMGCRNKFGMTLVHSYTCGSVMLNLPARMSSSDRFQHRKNLKE